MTLPSAATASSPWPPTPPAIARPVPAHPNPTRPLPAPGLWSTDEAASLLQAWLGMPEATITAVLLLAEGLLLVPLWAATRYATTAWQQLPRPASPSARR